MASRVLVFGDPPPTTGGDFERQAVREFRDSLPPEFLIIANPQLPTRSSYFYEYDAVVVAPDLVEIFELKAYRPEVVVLEDRLEGVRGFSADRVFTTLENKSRVLASRLMEPPFSMPVRPNVITRVIVPSRTAIRFKHEGHRRNAKVLTLEEAKVYLKGLQVTRSDQAVKDVSNRLCRGWEQYHSSWTSAGTRTSHSLGRFRIRRVLESTATSREFLAMDEAPCKVDVHLKEFPFDPLLGRDELERHLEDVSIEMRTLRRIRHPYISCVIGHFQTENSLVQVSDWFGGQSLEESWRTIEQCSLVERVGLMVKLSDALAFCHQRGVFHRNIIAGNLLIDDDLGEIRLRGFEFAKDLERTRTVSPHALQTRDPRTIPPEELLSSAAVSPRLADIFQAGVLFYRILEGGAFPYENAHKYCTGEVAIRPMTSVIEDAHVADVRRLILEMIDVSPDRRPEPFSRIAKRLSDVVKE